MLNALHRLTLRMRRSVVAFPLAVVVAALMLGISEVAYHEAVSQLNRLVLMGKVRLELARLVRRVADAESGQRGYLLTQRQDYLLPYRDANQGVQHSLDSLKQHFHDLGEADAQRQLAEVEHEVRAKLSEMAEVVALNDVGRVETARELLLSGIGRDQMDSIRQRVDTMLAAENQRVAKGLANVFDTLQLNRIGVATMTVISVLLLAMFLRLGRQLSLQRTEQQALVRAERDRLEQEVLLRTSELTELARHLETAREDERARLARDLHDELGALLTAAKLDVARMRPKLQQLAPEVLPRVAHLVETLNSGIALKRRIIEDLRPSTLDNLGLLPALEVMCSEFADRLGLAVHTRLQPVRLLPSAELTVFRLVQESLNNVAKHAGATEVLVTLDTADGQARIRVHDNGQGFDTDRPMSARHGLVGMRYRVQAEQGQLRVDSQPGEGTTLTALLPQQAAPAKVAPDA